MMFCDLVGSTGLATCLDPEDLREIIGAYHRAVAETVPGFDGFVAKYMGDGVLIYFGYPRAHEDDAERAVRAGLGLMGAARLPLGVPSHSLWAISPSRVPRRTGFGAALGRGFAASELSTQRCYWARSGHISSGQTLLFAGGFASSRSHFEEALALYDPILCRSLARHAGPHPQVSALGYLSRMITSFINLKL